MLRFLRKLNVGIEYDRLNDEQKDLIDELRKLRIVYNNRYKGKKTYALASNVRVSIRDNELNLEVFPNRSIGVFFDYNDLFDCVSSGKEAPIGYFLSYALNPDKELVENFELGTRVKVKVVARGYNLDNEGISVRLPAKEMEYYKMGGTPCITIGLSKYGKAKNTCNVDFDEPINNTFIEGRKGLVMDDKVYYNIRDVKDNSVTYSVKYEDNKYVISKVGEKKLFNR